MICTKTVAKICGTVLKGDLDQPTKSPNNHPTILKLSAQHLNASFFQASIFIQKHRRFVEFVYLCFILSSFRHYQSINMLKALKVTAFDSTVMHECFKSSDVLGPDRRCSKADNGDEQEQSGNRKTCWQITSLEIGCITW